MVCASIREAEQTELLEERWLMQADGVREAEQGRLLEER